jgi:hypothetical protein
MVTKEAEKKRGRGRPKELGFPSRLNLYIDSTTKENLEKLRREIGHERGEMVSIAETVGVAAAESPRLQRTAGTEPERPSRMTLSNAIRKGALAHPQGRPGMVFERRHGSDEILGSTALGAAWVGAGRKPKDFTTRGLAEIFPVLLHEESNECPAGGTCGTGRTLDAHIIHLDGHGWKRERIARWLEKRGL